MFAELAACVDVATFIDSKEPIRVDDDPVAKRPRGDREAVQRRVGMGLRGVVRAIEPGSLASGARMAECRQRAVSGGHGSAAARSVNLRG